MVIDTTNYTLDKRLIYLIMGMNYIFIWILSICKRRRINHNLNKARELNDLFEKSTPRK